MSAASAVLCLFAVTPAVAEPGAVSAAGPVSPRPASGTPQLARTGNTTEVVRQLVQCGSTMYAVASFTRIEWNGTVYDRSNILSFSATAPFSVTPWNPGVNGVVNSIAFSGGNCADAYIGGRFTAVHGTKASDIAEISTSTGSVVTTFRHAARSTPITQAAARPQVPALCQTPVWAGSSPPAGWYCATRRARPACTPGLAD